VTRSYQTARIEELEREDGWSPIRRQFEIQAFGVNAWTGREPGATVIPEHDEAPSGHEELYLVVTGHATFKVDGEEVDAPSGTLVFVRDPAVKRAAVTTESDTTVLTVGARPGHAYAPRAWETNVDVFPLFEAGKFEEAKRLLVDALGHCEDQGTLLYNLACAEARLGNADAAFDHLRVAIEHRPDLAAGAVSDDDLASLRDDPRFNQIVASPS
jgi:hypothetical protein